MSTIKRNRVTAVYLTDAERDLAATALSELRRMLSGHDQGSRWETLFARSFTAKRISALVELFVDKKGGTQ